LNGVRSRLPSGVYYMRRHWRQPGGPARRGALQVVVRRTVVVVERERERERGQTVELVV